MRTPVKKAPAKVKKPAAGSAVLRQRALELAVQVSQMDWHSGAAGGWPGSMGGTSRRYATDPEVLKTAKAFLDFMQGNRATQ